MTAYYNEIDPYAAQWLRNLIAAGHIAPGDVDERSIVDVQPDDLRGYVQCHFFAGIGVWSLAARLAGVRDDMPLWTGSCPCQPFSAAGQGKGFADERHLWPEFQRLIGECAPAVVAGEQVASKDADPWLDLVQTDLEALGYAFGAVAFPSAGVGAPHIRDRTYWGARRLADADGRAGREGSAHVRGRSDGGDAQPRSGLGGGGVLDRLAHSAGAGPQRECGDGVESARCASGGCAGGLGDSGGAGLAQRERERGILGGAAGRGAGQAAVGTGVHSGGLADANGRQQGHGVLQRVCEHGLVAADGGALRQGSSGPQLGSERMAGTSSLGLPQGAASCSGHQSQGHGHDDDSALVRSGPTNGYWSAADWLGCRDGKWRPVEPGTFPLAHGAASRVGRLRAYGNAINAQAAKIFLECLYGI